MTRAASRLALPVAAVILLGACATPLASVTQTPVAHGTGEATATATATPEPIVDIGCHPDADDHCAGPLSAGRHASVLFASPMTFDVPAGWANHADSAGEYVLLPPGSRPFPSDPGGGPRDWIAFEANVTLSPEGCAAEATFDPSVTAAQIAAWMAARAHLATSAPRPATVGGLSGVMIDVRLAPNAPPECFPFPAVMLVHGLPPSEYDQGIGPGVVMRFYFLDRGPDVLMVEIDDVSGGDRLEELSAVVDTVRLAGTGS
jgi:hypothetical protein